MVKTAFCFVVISVFGVSVANSQQQVVVNGAQVQSTMIPPVTPMPYQGPTDHIGQGIRESWVHEVRPLTRYEDATPYQSSPYNSNGTTGWFFNQRTGCWQRDIPCQYTYPQNNYYVPQQNYNYCVPQYNYSQPSGCWWFR